MTTREKQVFRLIQENPMIAQDEIAEKLGISRSAVSVHISSLLRQGVLRGRGYVVNDENYHVTVGTAGIDFLGLIDGELSDSVTEKIINYYGRINVSFGGAAYNISECLRRLDENVRMIATIGSDMFGRQIVEHCGELRINVDDCLYLHDMPQSIMMQMRDESIERNVSMVNYFAEARMSPQFFTEKRKMLRNAGSIVLTDIIVPESVEYLLSAHAESDLWFVLSGVISRIDRLRQLIGRAPHIYMNLRTAAHITGLPLTAGNETIAKRLRDCGVREGFVSCDNRTIVHLTEHACESYATLPSTRSDSERGKDAFVAGLVSTGGGERTVAERIRYASAVSLLALDKGRRDGSALSREAVERLLETM